MNFLKISNFKCFEEISIPINQLTVMAGANGNGKSTSIQALLLLRNTIENNLRIFEGFYTSNESINDSSVPLNSGYLLALGNTSYVINRRSSKGEISLSILQGKEEFFINYFANNQVPELFLKIDKYSEYYAETIAILRKEFYYLNAERIGPRVQQSIQHSFFPNAGWQGEFTAQLLDMEGGYWKILDERKFPDSGSSFLKDQANFWLDFIMPGTRVSAVTDPKTLSAQVMLENYYTSSEPTLSTNLGFGISYVLPIIVTGLTAVKDSILIIENPEAHLHPSAQSKIGRFLAMLARNGLKVIVESHSDHIIHGIQIAVAKQEISDDLVTINYFSHKEGNIQPDVMPISISVKGELSEWPGGFFDQTQIDYVELFKLRKG